MFSSILIKATLEILKFFYKTTLPRSTFHPHPTSLLSLLNLISIRYFAGITTKIFYSHHVLTAHHLKKSYSTGPRQTSVIEGLHLEIPTGTFATIQGVSGSGKSTLLHLLGGLDIPDEGDIRWNNTSLFSLSQNELSEWRNQTVGFIFQSYHLLQELNALENIELPAMIQGDQNNELSRSLLEKVGLAHRLEHRPLELSGGEQQRVAIARALRNRPQLLLADEPTGNLDRKTANEIIQLLLKIHQEEKMTILLVTHDSEIARLGEVQFQMENQKIYSQNRGNTFFHHGDTETQSF